MAGGYAWAMSYRDRRATVFTALLVVAALVVGLAGVRIALRLAMFALVGLAGYYLVSMLWKAIRPSRRRILGPVKLTLLPPPERYRGRSPTTLAQLVRALESATLGPVDVHPRSLRVTASGHPDYVDLTCEDPEKVTLDTVQLQTNSTDFALAVCDAIAPWVGPHVFAAEGVELFVDGTMPRWELERELFDKRMQRTRRVH